MQGVHDLAPGDVSVLVAEPGAHDWQTEEEILPLEGLYFPAAHSRQAEELELAEEGL